MDMVRDFQSTFDQIKDNPVKDVSPLIAVLKKHAADPSNADGLRWDVMRSVVSDDLDYVKLLTEAELESIYLGVKADIESEPQVIKVSAMLLHAHIKNYKSLMDVVPIQKRVLGDELFAVIEAATIRFIDKIYTDLLTKNIIDGMMPLVFAKLMYNNYEQDYGDTYYWPHMKNTMDKVLMTLH